MPYKLYAVTVTSIVPRLRGNKPSDSYVGSACIVTVDQFRLDD